MHDYIMTVAPDEMEGSDRSDHLDRRRTNSRTEPAPMPHIAAPADDTTSGPGRRAVDQILQKSLQKSPADRFEADA